MKYNFELKEIRDYIYKSLYFTRFIFKRVLNQHNIMFLMNNNSKTLVHNDTYWLSHEYWEFSNGFNVDYIKDLIKERLIDIPKLLTEIKNKNKFIYNELNSLLCRMRQCVSENLNCKDPSYYECIDDDIKRLYHLKEELNQCEIEFETKGYYIYVKKRIDFMEDFIFTYINV